MSEKKVERPVNIEKVYRPSSSPDGSSQNSYQGPSGSGEPKNPPSKDSAVPKKE